MEPRQPQKNRATESPPDRQTPRPGRFRIVKLEERIAPSKHKGWFKNTKACATFLGCGYSEYCW